MKYQQPTHSLIIGYALWIFGFMGSHRFYYGKPVSGTIWFFTLGLFFVGWLFDLIWIPRLQEQASERFVDGPYSYNVSWILLTFLGLFGVHRFYLGKWLTGVIWLCTGGLLTIGILYDYWNLNKQIAECNSST